MNVYQRGSLWYADVKTETGRKRVSTGIRVTEPNGEAKAKLVAAKLATGERVCRPSLPAAGGGMTLGEAFQRAWEEEWHKQKASSDKRLLMRTAMKALGSNTELKSLSRDQFYKWIDDLRKQGNSSATINRKLDVVSRVLNMALRWGVIEVAPYVPKPKETNRQREALSGGQPERIIEAEQHPEFRALWLFLRDTACRISEALKVRWQDIRDDVVVFRDRKGGDVHGVPLTPTALEALQALREADLPRPFRYSYRYCLTRFHEACLRAGIELPKGDATHLLRHTTATVALEHGASVRDVQLLLGHRQVTTTERYVHSTGAGLRRVVGMLQDALPAVSHLPKVCQKGVTNGVAVTQEGPHCVEQSHVQQPADLPEESSGTAEGSTTYEARSAECRSAKHDGEVAERFKAPVLKDPENAAESVG